jgi:lipoprotein-releasing system permease protein
MPPSRTSRFATDGSMLERPSSVIASLRFSRLVASRYLWSRRTDAAVTIITAISILGVAIGVITITVVMAVMTGFQVTLKEKILGADAHIVVRHREGAIGDWQRIKEMISAQPGVASVVAYTSHQGLLRAGERATGIIIRGLERHGAAADQVTGYLRGKQSFSDAIERRPIEVTLPNGESDTASIPSIIIGETLARTHGITPGATVSVLSPQVSSSPFGLVPKFRRFQVTSIYHSGLAEYESGLAYVSLSDAQTFFQMGTAVSGLEVRVRHLDDATSMAQKILAALGGASGGFLVQDWTQSNQAFFEALALEKKVYFIVLLLIIVMASFSIISSLVMVVIEKRRDIAIMKTLGARTAAIGNIFRAQGAIIGVIGVSVGLAGGYSLCRGLQWYRFPIDERIFQMSSLPIHIDPVNFIAVGVAAFLICCVATIYPARRASRFEPAEVLRHE